MTKVSGPDSDKLLHGKSVSEKVDKPRKKYDCNVSKNPKANYYLENYEI